MQNDILLQGEKSLSEDLKIYSYILKIASRCNLNCTYCYVYNKGDNTWLDKPKFMSDNVFKSAIDRIKTHSIKSNSRKIKLTFHGGEPCLISAEILRKWCEFAIKTLSPVEVNFTIQTNGTLIDQDFIDLFRDFKFNVGVSIDGVESIHNQQRITHSGKGSYNDVVRGIDLLATHHLNFGVLTVINFKSDPIETYRHFIKLGCKTINFILPDYTHDSIENVRAEFGKTPCSDYLIPIFDDWWHNSSLDIMISKFVSIIRLILGGNSTSDNFGNQPLKYMMLESNGDIEGLDCLRVCKEGITKTGLNILFNEISDLHLLDNINSKFIFKGSDIPHNCQSCTEKNTCGGGYLPHRYSSKNGFNNSSVWCADILELFHHIRSKIDVSVEETALRKQILEELYDFPRLDRRLEMA